MRHTALRIGSIVLACLVVMPAAAQTKGRGAASSQPVPLAQALTGDAKADYDTGHLLLADGDFAGALVKFQAAYDKSKDPRLLWNVAVCEKNLRHYAKVQKLVQKYKTDGAALITAKEAQDAEDLLYALKSLVSNLKIEVNEPGAQVFIDDELVGTSPLAEPITVDIGNRKVKVTKDGFTEYAEQVVVGNTAETDVKVKLEKIVHEGRLVVRAHAGDAIELDGKPVGTSQWEGAVASGGHTLRVTNKGMRPYQSEVVVTDKETRSISVTLEQEGGGGKVPTWAFIAGGAVLAAGAAVGGYFLFRPAPEQADFPKGNVGTGFVEASFGRR